MTDLDRLREQLRARTLADEPGDPLRLAERAALDADDQAAIVRRAIELIRQVRASSQPSMMESFLAEYGLSTDEGVALMCLAEAMLRVPDAQTLDELIQDKIVPHDWGAHVGDSGSILVNASTWALMLTGQMLEEEPDGGIVAALRGALRRLGEPLVRVAVARAMRELGAQFVLGRDIEEAISNGESMRERGYTYSYDMLGEAARTEADAARYLGAYAQAIAAISASARSDRIALNPGISVKLSALHPRYEPLQRDRVLPALTARLAQLARAAGQARLGLNIDAEEAERLDLSLDIVEALLRDPSLAGWDGLGVVVQAYGPRAEPLLDWLYALAGTLDRRLMVRLVKGAYWDY
ncbi:MAG: proline dehydrogenase family protein, partial [Gammaproteobacteria bacterium]|nr:proline dehydrogenase family protein [Gammaproteobacteria bacterium]